MTTIKYQANIETPTVYTEYVIDGNTTVTIGSGNRLEIEVQEWEAEGNTPEDAYTQEELDAYALSQGEQALISAINAIQVTYNGNVFSGSLEAQNRMVVAMSKLEGKGDIKTQNWFTVDSVKVLLTRDDLDNILDLVEPLMEAITDI